MSHSASVLLEALEAIAGPVEEVALSGGWSRSSGMRRLKERWFKHVTYPAVVEAGARGAVLFGGCAAGVFANADALPPPEVAESGLQCL
jgi:sugar (pentulose or hexulose) kinase